MKSIFIVDDHDIVRFGLESLFQSQPLLQLAGTANSLASALPAIAQLQPDLVITDMSMADSAGLDTVRAVVKAQGDRAVLVLSMHDELIYAEQVLSLGAQGYLMKNFAHALVVQVAQTLLEGKRWVSEDTSAQILNRLVGRGSVDSHRPERQRLKSNMTMREVQVLEKIGAGQTTKEIAYGLSLSPRTVDVYRASVKKKLGLRSGTELVAFAVSRL